MANLTNGRPPMPSVVDRSAFETELDALRAREKARTREGDAIAAARRWLPMVEVDPATPLLGPDGSLTMLDAFEGASSSSPTGGRKPGRTRRPDGRNEGSPCVPRRVRPVGGRSWSGPAAAPRRNGRESKPGRPTTSAEKAERRWLPPLERQQVHPDVAWNVISTAAR